MHGVVTSPTGVTQSWKDQGLFWCCLLCFKDLEFEAAVKFSPAVCPGCTPLAGRELFAPCSKSDPEVAFLCPPSLAPLEEKPYPPHQCSDVHFRTQSTDACQIFTKINPSGALNFSCKHIHSTDPYPLLPHTLTHT